MVKNLKKHLVWIFFIFLAVIGTIFAITAQDNAGKIEISKTATKMITNDPNNNLVYGRKAKVELNVKANPYNKNITTYDKLDVVLVLDSSGSMGDNNKLTNLKGAARDLVNTLMNDGTNQVGVVEFGTNVKRIHQLTTNKNNINRFINRMSADGGTNVQQAVASANTILQDGKRDDAQQIVIILTDGIPTFFNYNGQRYGTGNTDDSVCVERGWMGCLKQMKPSEAAKTELDKLKSNNKTADVYTIVFGNDEDAKNILATINPEQEKPLYKNYNALSGEDLKKMFQTIIEESVGRIGNNSVLTDIIPKEFKLTNASKTRLIQQGVEIIDNVDGTTTLKWDIGNIDADIDYKLSYEVRADENYHGSMYTNENATLKTTVSENNPYYENTDLTLTFDKPAVEIPAITKNDHYNHNESYIGYSESTINGTSILNNDRNKNILENIHTGNTQTTAEDEIIIVTDDNTKANLDGTYSIYKDGVLQGTLDMNEDGTFSFISEEGITGEVTFDYVIKTSINQNHETSFVISNTSKVTLKILERQKINITGTKTWNDDNDRDGKRPDSITVILRAGNKEIQRKIVTKDNNWSYTFENLYKYEKGHENDSEYEISYTVEEQKVEGYTTSVDNNNNITNTHEIEKTQVVGKKSWVDSNDKDGLRPESIKIILKANGKEVASKVISASDKGDNSNEWIYSFTDLDMYKDGEKIIYTVDEEVDSKTKEHYTKSYDENNKNIIVNTHNPKDVTVKGTKTWDDNNNQDGKRLDEITVNLKGMIGDEVVVEKSTKVSEYTNCTFSFKWLPEYSKGKLINYTISENAVKDYNTSIVYDAAKDSYEITNTHTPETINISGTKTWEDKDNQDGIRPESITITLYDHLGKEVGETTATEKTNWTYTFDNLPKYANGKEIKYTVKETSQINGYETIVKDFDITNRHTPETVSYKVTKVWNDNNNQDGIRPDSITVRIVGVITKDGTVKVVLTKEQKISAANNWTYTFKDLPKYNKGEPVIYEIVEDVVKGYTSNVSQDKEKYNGTITNTHKVAKKNIKVTKTWKDNNNKINKRPESITVNVLKNGEFFKQIILTKDMNWMFILNNLDKFENGKEIIYTIEELKVKGYTTTYNGYNIINTLINKRSSNKVIPVIKGKVEITPPSTGIESNNDINLLEGLLITFLLVGTVVTPIRLIKNN